MNKNTRGRRPRLQFGVLVRKRLPFCFGRERNQKKSEKKHERDASDWDTECSHAQHSRTEKEIDSGSNETTDGGTKRESGRAYSRLELFGKP